MIRSILQLVLALVLSTALAGCKKEEPNPELLDPIYKDLEARHAAYSKNVEESKAKIPVLEESISKAEARSIDLKNFEKELSKEKLKLMNSEQLARYYRIRAERRKLTDRIEYKKAFAADKVWPDPHEYSDYLVNIRLQEANRNWGARVPKLQDRMPGSAPAKPKAPAEGEGEAAPKGH
jgi:hypothetical protein